LQRRDGSGATTFGLEEGRARFVDAEVRKEAIASAPTGASAATAVVYLAIATAYAFAFDGGSAPTDALFTSSSSS
jgi:hypothetical protein